MDIRNMRTGTVAALLALAVSGCNDTGPRYRSCEAASSAGAAPLHRGEPGYSRSLDKDGDGTACEEG